VPKLTSRVAGLAAAGLLGVGALLIPGTGSGAAPAPGTGSAFGVSATGTVTIAPTPLAPPNNTVATIDQPPVLTARALSASSTPNATGVTSMASVADVNALAGAVRATLITSTCTASGTTLTGSSTLAGLTLTGLPTGAPITVPVNPAPNTVITIPGVATVVLNEQITSNNGQTLTVNAVRITSLVAAVPQEIIIADSMCTLAAAAATTTSSAPAATTTSSAPAATTSTTTTRGSSGTGTAPGATPVQGRPAFTG